MKKSFDANIYDVVTLLDDLQEQTQVKLMYADRGIPAKLWGDECGIRQVLLRVLEGATSWEVSFSVLDMDNIMLMILIKSSVVNPSINDVKYLVRLMEGVMKIEQEEEEFLTYQITIPQGIRSERTVGNFLWGRNDLNGGDSIDIQNGMMYCGGSGELYKDLVRIFIEQSERFKKELKECVENKDWANYRILVHSLKGNSRSIGADTFSEASRKQEEAAKEENEEFLLSEFENYYERYERLLEMLKN